MNPFAVVERWNAFHGEGSIEPTGNSLLTGVLDGTDRRNPRHAQFRRLYWSYTTSYHESFPWFSAT